MNTEKWFLNLLDSLKDDFDFRLESIILDLTEQIAKKMKAKGISRKKLADLLNVSPPAVTKILNGTSNFTLKTLLSLADALELDLVIDLKERDAGDFQLVTAQHYGPVLKETANFAFFASQEEVTWAIDTPGDAYISQQVETQVTSGTSVGAETEMIPASGTVSRRNEIDQEAA